MPEWGTVSNVTSAYTLLDPDRYCFTFDGGDVVENRFYNPNAEAETGPDGKPIQQSQYQYKLRFKVSDPSAPDEFFTDEQTGNTIYHTEWYGRRDDGVIGKKSRAYRVFAALLGGTELPDDADVTPQALKGQRMIAMIVQKASQDGKTIRGKIAKDSEAPYAVPGAKKFGRQPAAAASGAGPF